ncbi:MAG: BlaI/MecI/CopY family transcriptional regulator [Phycisphaerae bacterium]|nr:BlaI/MecI/CopY family transcriptional regulator [Phycisphaerae bacterium]
MAKNNDHITDTELLIMNVIWRREHATIREIASDIYGSTDTSEYGTVQSLLNRLESKGFIKRDRSGFAHEFHALIQREQLVAQQLTEVANKVCQGSFTPLLMQLVGKIKLSDQEREQLKKMIDEK